MFVPAPEVDDRIELLSPRFPNARFLSRVRQSAADHLAVTVPMVAGEPMRLERGEKLALRWREEMLLICRVQGTSRGGLVAELDVLEELPQQRRSYFRWTVPLPVRFAVVEQQVRGPWRKAQTLDVSGGGLSVAWETPVAQLAELEIELSLEAEPIRCLARVVAARANPAAPPPFLIALEFVRISDADRSRIVRYIFRKQWSARAR